MAMTYEEFVETLASRLEAAQRKPMQDLPGIDAAIEWAARVIGNSPDWGKGNVSRFIEAVGRRMGALDERDPRTGQVLKRAQSNTAFLALLAKADILAQSAKGGK